MARKILLADDSVTAQNMGRKILADAGYEVLTVNNGSAALKRINEVKPDLIVLDVYMPGYSGLEVCQRLKDAPETAHIPVLLTVGKLEPFKPDEARRAKADAHIVKPFEASELLSAIARLEDRIVAHADGRKSAAGGEEDFASADPDTGWKSRLRFPSKKKKQEEPADTELEESTGNFRNFRKGKGKAASSRVNAPQPAAPEPAIVPDIPRDITPEELDALSALAAKLDGPVAVTENIGAVEEKPSAPVEAVSVPAAAPVQAEAVPAPVAVVETVVAEAKAVESVVEPPVTETKVFDVKADEASAAAASVVPTSISVATAAEASKEFEVPAAAAEVAAAVSVARNEIEIPVQQVELPTETAAAEPVAVVDTPLAEAKPAEPATIESKIESTQIESSEIEAAPSLDAATPAVVNAASLAEEPAPIDQGDEPRFAEAAVEMPEASAAEKIEEQVESKAPDAIASSEQDAPVEQAVAQAEEPSVEAPKTEELKLEETKAPALKAEEIKAIEETKAEEAKPEVSKAEQSAVESAMPVAVVANHEEAVEAEPPAPSDEELAEALRLLTPATGNAETIMPSHGTLVAAGQLLAEEAARNASAAPRWVAQSVELTPEEAAISLEAEMFKTFAAAPGSEEIASNPIASQISAATAVVESAFLEPGLSSDSAGSGEPASQQASEPVSESVPEAQAANVATPEATAIPEGTPDAGQRDSLGTAAEQEIAEQTSAGTSTERAVEGQASSSENASESAAAEQSYVEQAPMATFADADRFQTEAGSTAQDLATRPETAGETPAAVEEEHQDLSSESGGQEDMAKDGKGKSGKSNWHQIHATPASAAKNDVVEAAKQEASTEEAPKAMAAAAAATEGSKVAASTPASEASAIASIVDSVLADLRPKIVEEIAKKLAGK